MLLILGASTRAAAFSALRAGFEPVCVDRFADDDLAAVCTVARAPSGSTPEELRSLADRMPPGPWMYTGAIENHPELVASISESRPLWGNDAKVLRPARDPIHLVEVLRSAGVPALDARLDPSGVPRDGSWLVKPIRSAGGGRIRPLLAELPEPGDGVWYYQRRQEGRRASAVFLGDGRKATLIGVTHQWIGRRGAPFGYVGSIGPVWPRRALRARLVRMGEVLAGLLGLRGLFGVDVVIREGIPWPTEVNPRYTASVEVIEHGSGRPSLLDHAACFESGTLHHRRAIGSDRRNRIVGKLILFAPVSGRIPETHRWPEPPRDPWIMPAIADVPAPGSTFQAGQPVLTLLERGSSVAACRRRLLDRRAAWWARLRSWAIDGGEDRART